MTLLNPIDRDCAVEAGADPLPPDCDVAPTPRTDIADIYRSQRGRLLRFFSRRAGRSEADDLVHETFARFADRADRMAEPVAEPGAYLTRAATNLLRDRAKFAVRRATIYHQVFNDDEVAGEDPVHRLEQRDLLRRLDAAVQRLKPRTRRVFLLQRVEGMTYGQIADETGMSAKAVKKEMAKALFELRRDVGPF